MADTQQVATGVREGDLLAGKYRIDKILGVGGMGVVVAAHHIELDEKVAIKFLLPETLDNEEAVHRFAREARAAVKIKSEHVAKVTDVGKLETGAPYMVMEYLEGGDLSAWLEQRGALPVDQAIEFVLQGCEAIAEAHALGIVHRDLKPANLFVIRRADGVLSVKVLDFGISKMAGLGGSGGPASMTRTSALMGSPLYMSPEQMQSSRDVDARGDVWALGVILYELVTGVPPFSGESMPELILQIMSAAPPPVRSKRPDAPDGLEAVIAKCLEKDRGRRFQNVGELAVALLPFAPRRSRTSVERISGVLHAAGLAGTALALPPSSDRRDEQPANTGTAASWGRTTTGKATTPKLAFAGAGIAILILVSVVAARKFGKADATPSASAPSLATSVAIPASSAPPTAAPELVQDPPPTPPPAAEREPVGTPEPQKRILEPPTSGTVARQGHRAISPKGSAPALTNKPSTAPEMPTPLARPAAEATRPPPVQPTKSPPSPPPPPASKGSIYDDRN